LKYLVSYAQLMRNYFINMVFPDILSDLIKVDAEPENADLNNLGSKMILITCLIVKNSEFPQMVSTDEISEEQLNKAKEIILTDDFRSRFEALCQMDIIPEIDISEIKLIKMALIDPLVTNNQEQVQRLGNAGRLLSSWIDGVLEYTILKHEVVVLRLKNKRVLEKI
jgi:hypothetical protein